MCPHACAPRLLAITLVALSGCGYKTGFVRDAISSQALRYDLQISGLQFLRTVSAESSYQSLFCIIPWGDALYRDAMRRLHQRAGLEANQVILNLREDVRLRSYLVLCKYQLVLSGDVFQLHPARGRTPVTPASAPAAPAARRPAPPAEAPEPRVAAIHPAVGPAGVLVTLRGEHLERIRTAWLIHPSAGRMALELRFQSPGEVLARVPLGCAGGVLEYESDLRRHRTQLSYSVTGAARPEAGSPREAPRDDDLQETLEPEQIRSVITRLLPGVKACFRRHRFQGRASTRITVVGRTGAVSAVALVGDDEPTAIADCLQRVLRQAVFPRFKMRTQSFVYPFVAR